MRGGALTAILLVALAGGAADAAPPGPWRVHCDAVTLRPTRLDATHRVVLGHVAFQGRRVFQVAEVGGSGYRYWSKVLLFVRPGNTPVVIGVPPAWRDRVGIVWGSPVAAALRIEGCAIPPNLSPNRWNGYVGGLYVRAPGCVPLIVRVRERSTVIRFGLGKACA
jgi:hypothetical protein